MLNIIHGKTLTLEAIKYNHNSKAEFENELLDCLTFEKNTANFKYNEVITEIKTMIDHSKMGTVNILCECREPECILELIRNIIIA